jgi:hypothetical protein
MLDVIERSPDPPNISPAEREFREGIRQDMKEAEQKGWELDTSGLD